MSSSIRGPSRSNVFDSLQQLTGLVLYLQSYPVRVLGAVSLPSSNLFVAHACANVRTAFKAKDLPLAGGDEAAVLATLKRLQVLRTKMWSSGSWKRGDERGRTRLVTSPTLWRARKAKKFDVPAEMFISPGSSAVAIESQLPSRYRNGITGASTAKRALVAYPKLRAYGRSCQMGDMENRARGPPRRSDPEAGLGITPRWNQSLGCYSGWLDTQLPSAIASFVVVS